MTPERWAAVCAELENVSGAELPLAIDAKRDEVLRWPAAVRHLNADSPWLNGLFEGRLDPRLELVGHAAIRHRHEYTSYTVRTGELFPIMALLGHHLDPAFNPPDVVLGQEDNIVSAYGCGGGSAWEKRGDSTQWIYYDCSATEHAAGMSTDDSWTAHGLAEGVSLEVQVEDSFGGSYGFAATGFTPAIFELALAWQAVLRGATAEEVRALLATRRGAPARDE
jgi:hypothetical protein